MNDTELIVQLIREQDEKMGIRIKGLHKNMEAGFDAFNGKLERLHEKIGEMSRLEQQRGAEIKKLEKDTALWRWTHRNPKLSSMIFGIFFSGAAWVLGNLDKEKIGNIIKKLIGL